MKWALVAIAIVSPHVAEAGHGCYEPAPVVGYARCSRFGGWAGGAPMWWDAGIASLRFDPGKIDATTTALGADGTSTVYHVVSVGDQPISATGFAIAASIGFPHQLYVTSEANLMSVTSAPALVADVSARGVTNTMGTVTRGTVMQGGPAFGAFTTISILTLRTEVAPGFRIATLQLDHLPSNVRAIGLPWFVLSVRQRAEAWLTPNVTLGVAAAVNVLEHYDLTVSMFVGLHVTPFDGSR